MPMSLNHPFGPSSSSPDLTAIAATLTEAAQALRNFGKTLESVPPDDDGRDDCADHKEPSGPFEERYQRGEFHAEYRCFHLPEHVVRREYVLLREYGLDTFAQLVNRVYEELYAAVLLMRHVDGDADISGFELRLISDNLSRPLDLLNSLCSQLADVELVQKTTVPV